jgi:hypothetical protein
MYHVVVAAIILWNFGAVVWLAVIKINAHDL